MSPLVTSTVNIHLLALSLFLILFMFPSSKMITGYNSCDRHMSLSASKNKNIESGDNSDSNAVSRRRNRRSRRRKEGGNKLFPTPELSQTLTSPTDSAAPTRFAEKQVSPEMKQRMEESRKQNAGTFGEKSIEETFGLGDDQLKGVIKHINQTDEPKV